ncbi:MAG: hypothetical protein ACN4GR_01635, partial [Arenicellales bacterium]
MAIEDLQYNDWLADRASRPVHLVELTHTSGAVSRLSERAFRPADSQTAGQLWRARLNSVDIDWGIDGGIGGYSELSVSRIKINNADRALDRWRDDAIAGVAIKLGDERWDAADFRTLITGNARRVKVGKVCEVEIRGNEDNADTIKNISLSAALPGTMLQTLLTTYGGYTTGDINTTRLSQLDTDYPYTIAAISGDFNLLDAADKVLSGLPVDWGSDFDGLITLFELSNATGASSYREIKPVAVKEPEVKQPVWRVTLSGDFGDDETTERAATKTAYPAAIEINLKTHVSSSGDRDLLANKLLDLYSAPRDLVKLSTDRRDRFTVGDEVKLVFPGLGYDSGRY